MTTLKVVVAPQALKGSLEAPAVGNAIGAGVRAVFPDAILVVVPVADGGEGTVKALVSATGGRLVRTQVLGPLSDPVEAEFGLLGSGSAPRTAVLEMAAASGLTLLTPDRRDPRLTSTYGTGQLIRAALDVGCERLLIGIGGSATNDGGAGMAVALGVRLLDGQGEDLPPGGAALARLERVDAGGIDERLRRVKVQVACDVSNPLTGREGASAVYGPQKGATPEMVRELDAALAHFAAVVKRDLGVEVADIPGAGAAGGLGAGLLAFTKAQLLPGAQLVLEALDFPEVVRQADLVITAEGQLDAQTAYGKAVAAVAAAGRAAGAAVLALAGSVTSGVAELDGIGIDVALPIAAGPMNLEESMERAPELLEAAAVRAMRLVAIGERLRREPLVVTDPPEAGS